jgi:hypothetical protein
VRDDSGDTIFGIDAEVEDILIQHCQEWGKSQHFVLVAEGSNPAACSSASRGAAGRRSACWSIRSTARAA